MQHDMQHVFACKFTVIGSAEHHQQKWLFFFEGRQTQNSEDNIELGDGGWHDLSGVVQCVNFRS